MDPASAEGRSARRGRAAAVAFVLVGIAFRAALAFPTHKYPADADCLNSGLVALKILDGRPQVFYTPRRLGALECYVHAASFEVFGVGRPALAVAPFLAASVSLILWAWLARALLGPLAGAIAILLLALPPPAYSLWTYMPNTYPETMLLSIAILAAAARIQRSSNPPDARNLALFGCLAGLGFWNSIQTLAATLPAFVWLLASRLRRDALVRIRPAALVLAAFVFGALPWIAWNVLVPLGSFQGNFSVRPTTGAVDLARNVAYLGTYSLPELTASLDPEGGSNPPSAFRKVARPFVLVIWAAAGLFALLRTLRWLKDRLKERHVPRPSLPDAPLLLVGAAILTFATLSAAGQSRGLTVRYVLPLYLTLAAALALLLAAVARRSRATAGALLVLVLAFDIDGAFLPGTAARRLWASKRDADAKLVAFLETNRIEVVFGDYWAAYPVNFLSKRTIRGIPFGEGDDFYDVEKALPAGPLRFAVVARTRDALDRISRNASLPGLVTEVGVETFVLVPDREPADARALAPRLRAADAEPASRAGS